MHVTRQSDYALRVLMYLALKGGESATVGEIAGRFDISRHHLTKVVHRLHQAGHLLATRGRNGGLTLPRPAGEINVGAVFRSMENELGVVECLRAGNRCVLDGGCELKRVFDASTEAFLAVLDAHSLADLLPPSRADGLRGILAIAS